MRRIGCASSPSRALWRATQRSVGDRWGGGGGGLGGGAWRSGGAGRGGAGTTVDPPRRWCDDHDRRDDPLERLRTAERAVKSLLKRSRVPELVAPEPPVFTTRAP